MSLSSTYQSRKNLLAQNLTTMGVTASGTEGLTTLIDKVLDIPTGVSFDEIQLSSNKSILSYYDSESATLTAQLYLNGNPIAVENVTVTFKRGSTTLGTANTDSTGLATYTYNSTGAGDITITSQAEDITDTTTIEDCKYYADTTKVNSWSTSTGSNFTDYNSTYTMNDGEIAYFKLNTLPNYFRLGLVDGNSHFQLYKTSGTYYVYVSGSSNRVSTSVTVDTVMKFERVSSTVQKLYIDDTLLYTTSNHSFSNPKPMIRKYSTTYNMDYVKVK